VEPRIDMELLGVLTDEVELGTETPAVLEVILAAHGEPWEVSACGWMPVTSPSYSRTGPSPHELPRLAISVTISGKTVRSLWSRSSSSSGGMDVTGSRPVP
jgi:hypothetical protein